MSIAKKGLAIIFLLVAVELSMGLLIHQQLRKAESEASREAHFKDIYLHTQAVSRNLYAAHEALVKWSDSPTKTNEETLQIRFKGILEEIKYLSKHLDREPQQTQLLNVLQESAQRLFNRINYWVAEVNKADELAKAELIQSSIIDMRQQKRQIQSLAVSFLKLQEERFNNLPPSQDTIRKNMQIIVALALCANVIFAICLALLFSRDINSRLMRILENTGRLKSSKDLLPVLSGRDEIAQLDQSFHAMAQEMKEYDTLRSSYVAMFRDELSQPLENVYNNFHALLKGEAGAVSKKGLDLLRSGERNLFRLIGIVDDLTDTGDADGNSEIRMQIRDVELKDVLERSIESVYDFATKKGVTIELQCEEDYLVQADSNRLIQVLVNFLSNAAKFSPKGEKILLRADTTDSAVRVSVVDKGRGVPKENQASIFEKFQQVSSEDGKRGSGTGLGLNICKRIIEQHGGKIGCESEPGQGSTFWFEVSQKEKNA